MSSIKDVKISMHENHVRREVDLFIYTPTHLARPLTMEPTGNDRWDAPATVELTHDSLQEFFDQMWASGYRPTDYSNHDKTVADQRDLIERQQQFIDSLLKEIDALARPVIVKGAGRWASI